MGKGLALQFKERFPLMFVYYQAMCKTRVLMTGKPILYQDSEPEVLLFPTKDHWRNQSQMEYISEGLEHIAQQIRYNIWKIKSIAFPKLGCGLGRLSWKEVLTEIEDKLGHLKDLSVEVYGERITND